MLGHPRRVRRRGDLRAGLAHRLARRLPGAPAAADHLGRAGARPDRRQAADLGDAGVAGAARAGPGVDGGGDHRPRVRGHRPAQPGLLARPDDPGLAARQAQDGHADRGRAPAAARLGALPAPARPGPAGAVGGDGDDDRLGGGLLLAVQPRRAGSDRAGHHRAGHRLRRCPGAPRARPRPAAAAARRSLVRPGLAATGASAGPACPPSHRRRARRAPGRQSLSRCRRRR